jgi:Arc/MetJ family transcription regulator
MMLKASLYQSVGGEIGARMTTTQINLDDQTLAEAARVLGTKTKVDTVNSALRAVVAQHRQRSMLERAARDGTYKGLPEGDDAWR